MTKAQQKPNERSQKCEDRIDDHLASRLRDFAALTKAASIEEVDELTTEELSEVVNLREPDRSEYTAEQLREQAQERINEYPLSVEVRRTVVVQISWGGPSDEFECDLDSEGEIDAIRYRFKDWFDGAVRELHGEEYETAKAFLSNYVECLELR